MGVDIRIGGTNGRTFRMGGQAYEARAVANHGVHLDALAKSGGLTWIEAAAIVQDRSWRAMDVDAARSIVIEALGSHHG